MPRRSQKAAFLSQKRKGKNERRARRERKARLAKREQDGEKFLAETPLEIRLTPKFFEALGLPHPSHFSGINH